MIILEYNKGKGMEDFLRQFAPGPYEAFSKDGRRGQSLVGTGGDL